jgi:tetratricopeptide (TPR) repeat protein
MKRMLRIGLPALAAALLLVHAPGRAADHARLFLSALEFYQAGDYGQAAERFEALTNSGIRSGALFYNLGNAHLKDGRLGPAILWYERAARLTPNDPDLRFNLQYARSLAEDAPGQGPASMLRTFYLWTSYLGQSAVMLAAVIFNMLFWLFLGVWVVTRRRLWFRSALGTGLAALIVVAAAGVDLYAAGRPSQGIVLPQKISIRSGLEDTSTELFKLHAGARVKVIDRRDEHYLIRFSPEKIGWVDRNSIGLIQQY